MDELEGRFRNLARATAENALLIGQIFCLLNSRYKLDSSLSVKGAMGSTDTCGEDRRLVCGWVTNSTNGHDGSGGECTSDHDGNTGDHHDGYGEQGCAPACEGQLGLPPAAPSGATSRLRVQLYKLPHRYFLTRDRCMISLPAP